MTIWCVAKNYAAHAKEMGAEAPSMPVWFLKPESAIVHDGQAIRIPRGIGEVHHEVEWALRIGPDGVPDAMTVAIDVTARDLQKAAKEAGRPWTMSKGFDTFLAIGPWLPYAAGPHGLRLMVDDAVRQDGSTADMVHDVDALLAHLGSWATVAPGDIILTGTPEGVGPIVPGDTVHAELVGHVRCRFPVVEGQ